MRYVFVMGIEHNDCALESTVFISLALFPFVVGFNLCHSALHKLPFINASSLEQPIFMFQVADGAETVTVILQEEFRVASTHLSIILIVQSHIIQEHIGTNTFLLNASLSCITS